MSTVVATAEEKRRASKVVRALKNDYPDAKCSLNFDSPVQLLIATILSAQCTDERVNLVTAQLFQKHKAAADFARLRLPALERAIQSTGFFRNKAKNIKACCRELVDRYDGVVPQAIDQLVALPGVGRKTANVVLGTAYGIASGVVVDTHVSRISKRLGLTEMTDAVKIEADLNAQLPKKEWIAFSHRLIQHGRKICTARRPDCEQCSMKGFCPRVGVAGS
jgi:endonuclease-3